MKTTNQKKDQIIKKGPLFLTLIIFINLILGIGYAEFANIDLKIEGEASANSAKEVMITDIKYVTSTNVDHTLSVINEPYLTIMNSKIILGNDLSSEITFKIKIKNNTDFPATYVEAIYDTEIGYDNTDIQFFLNGINTGNILNPKEEKEFTITFKYKELLSEITNNTLNSYINFKFNIQNKVAKINDTYFDTLQSAINSITEDNIETKIELLQNTSELLEINQNKKIIIDLQNHTISNHQSNPIIENNGSLIIKNGAMTTNAPQGAINNEETGNLKLENLNITATGTKQALYNNGGIAEITGNSTLTSTSNQRPTLQNINNGTLIIKEGTIISYNFSAVINEANMIIGIKDDDPNRNSPSIQGKVYGINSTKNYNFYNGSIKGQESPTNNQSYINDKEERYNIAQTEEIIEERIYKVIFLAETYTVTFDANGGTVNETTRNVAKQERLCTPPIATKSGYILIGWFTDSTTGTQINEDTIVNDNITYYAHWVKEAVAEINGVEYNTIQEAINNVSKDNTPTTINLLRNTHENITINANQNITLNLQNYTLTNNNENQVVNNRGTLNIINGTIISNASKATIDNNENAKLIVSANVISTGTRQAIYNLSRGYVEINENSNITSSATGTPDTSAISRGTVQNLRGGTIKINGGTITGLNQQAISNEGLLTIGQKDGNINNSTPIIQGETYGIISTGTINFYDGTIKGITDSILGNITDNENEIINATETINNKIYKVTYNSN